MGWQTPGRIAGAGLLVALGVASYATLIERNSFVLRRKELVILPPGNPKVRVLHLSDVHMAPWQRAKSAWISELAELQPDLIINTGDNLGHPDALPALRAAFDGFAGSSGVFVNGSNDYFAPEFKNPLAYLSGPSTKNASPKRLDTGAMEKFFVDDLGWTNLNNAARQLVVSGVCLEVFGVDDPHHGFDNLPAMMTSLEGLRESNEFGAALSVGVTHAPYQRVLNAFVSDGADLIFAGHTHGGQVCLPGFGALVTNCDLPRSMARGISRWAHGSRHAILNVSAGLGTSIYAPVRFACRPEATLLTLSSRSD